jgi:membrane protein required for colicin V production
MITLAPLDYALLAIVLVSTVVGLFRGIFREAMSLAVWIVAVWVAGRYAAAVAPHLAGFVANAQLQIWGARVALLIGVLLVGGIVSWLVATALHSTGLGGVDRIVGMVFGLARGALLAGLAVITLELAGFNDEPWWRESKLIPYAAPVTNALRKAAEEGLSRSWSSSISRMPDVAAGSFTFRS